MPGTRVAYILLWFPEPSQTFILNEVNTLVQLGLDLKVYTLYGPRPASRLRGMVKVLAPVHHLGIATLPILVSELMRLSISRGIEVVSCIFGVAVRRWRSLETAGEALWALWTGLHLARVMAADGISHIHAPWANGPATSAWVASMLSGIPFSFSGRAHDLFPPDGALEEKMRAATFIRTNTQINQRYLTGLFPHLAGKVVNIYNGISMAPSTKQRPTARPPYQLLALGRFVPKKGFPILIEACRLLVDQGLDFQLTLAGDGPERGRIRKLIERQGLSGRVSLAGWVPYHEVALLMRQTDLIIVPSLIAPSGDRDGIPNVILEALLCKVPVVASAVSGIPEVVKEGNTGWPVDQVSPESLAQAVVKVLADPEEARRRAKQGRELVIREFNSMQNSRKLKNLLEGFQIK